MWLPLLAHGKTLRTSLQQQALSDSYTHAATMLNTMPAAIAASWPPERPNNTPVSLEAAVVVLVTAGGVVVVAAATNMSWHANRKRSSMQNVQLWL